MSAQHTAFFPLLGFDLGKTKSNAVAQAELDWDKVSIVRFVLLDRQYSTRLQAIPTTFQLVQSNNPAHQRPHWAEDCYHGQDPFPVCFPSPIHTILFPRPSPFSSTTHFERKQEKKENETEK